MARIEDFHGACRQRWLGSKPAPAPTAPHHEGLRAFLASEAAHGPEHPAVASVVANLLTVYLSRRRDGEVGPLFQRSLTLAEPLLGPRPPDLASS